jgi:hypothetical protein
MNFRSCVGRAPDHRNGERDRRTPVVVPEDLITIQVASSLRSPALKTIIGDPSHSHYPSEGEG